MNIHLVYLVGIFFLIGSAVGSFCGVLIEDNVRKRKIWTGRSQCVACKHVLRWYELIPIFSYIRQKGRCLNCRKGIPAWIFHIEWMMALLWGTFGALFVMNEFSLTGIFCHLFLLSIFLTIAVYDARTMMIPDRLTLPAILLAILSIVLFSSFPVGPFLIVLGQNALWGAIAGMLFYLIQMIVPAFGHYAEKGRYGAIFHLLFLPIVFPFWLVLKVLIGEKRADKLIPTIALLDEPPTWVGGGDVRLGIFVGMLVGPMNLLWVISIGYIFGVLYFGLMKMFSQKKIAILPVAPLLFVGLCVVWAGQLL